MRMPKAHAATYALLSSLSAVVGCRQQVEIGHNAGHAQRDSDRSDMADTGAQTGPRANDAMAEGATADGGGSANLDAESGTCSPVRCRGGVRACADCVDNDADGKLDAEDPDCWSPCDDSEDTLAGGTQMCPAGDCFFDPDCGAGNDALCLGLTPNGCDCFGCCTVPSGISAVFLGSTDSDASPSCTSSSLDNPERCQPCTPEPTCFNACEDCELCFAQDALPDSCISDASCNVPACSDGRAACGGCAGACALDELCISGCCAQPR